jgi:phospholipid/cholesterol/gamma-HCH transport system ATP-binding protein
MVDSSPNAGDPVPLLRVERLGAGFGRQPVLRDIDLSIARGETVAIIGESGCGKTVLLKTLIALLRPTHGTVYFDGQDIHRMNQRNLTRTRIRFGFLFQQAALFDSMTVAQNVAFPLRQHSSRPEREIREIVVARLAEVGLPESVLSKKPAELSGGMRKRVGLARALTSGLDPIMSDVINELILNTRRRHPVTSIVVTHDMRTARKVADRVVMLYPLARLRPHEPQVLYDGPPERLESAEDRRVRQFVLGEAGERLMEMRGLNGGRDEG